MNVKTAILNSKAKQYHPQVLQQFSDPEEKVRIYKLKNKIQQFRAEKCISQYVLAFQVHISRQALNKIERGLSIPSVLVALELANYFNVSVEDIFQSEMQYYED